ncbi:MAG: zf-HC2 domain-containing protein [Spirochaetes bacterium]|nr:zf-HC2 domain-containing protein [Spirochaetota bacterium]
MNCDAIENLIQRSLDHELPDALRRPLEAHLASCPACRALHGELAGLLASLGSMAIEEPLAGFEERVMEKIRREAGPRGEAASAAVVALYVSMGATALLLAAAVLLGDAGVPDLLASAWRGLLGFLGDAWVLQAGYDLLAGLVPGGILSIPDTAAAACGMTALAALLLGLRRLRAPELKYADH